MFLGWPQHCTDYSKHFELFLQSQLNYFIKQEVQIAATGTVFCWCTSKDWSIFSYLSIPRFSVWTQLFYRKLATLHHLAESPESPFCVGERQVLEGYNSWSILCHSEEDIKLCVYHHLSHLKTNKHTKPFFFLSFWNPKICVLYY